LKCLCLNARSIVNKFDLFHATVSDIDADVIGITESWATENITDSELSMRGYQLFRRDRSTGNRGGGVLLYVKNVWQPVAFDVSSTYGEHIWCRVSGAANGGAQGAAPPRNDIKI